MWIQGCLGLLFFTKVIRLAVHSLFPSSVLTPMKTSSLVVVLLVLSLMPTWAQDAGPATWQDADIGSAATGGGVQADGAGGFNIVTSSTDIWGKGDAFHFVYQPLNGNGQLVGRVLGIQGTTNQFAKAGLMLRATLLPNARNVMMVENLKKNTYFQWRTRTNSRTFQVNNALKVVNPYWFKVVRNGDWVGGYRSPDGSNWELVQWENLQGLPTQVYVGLAVASGSKQGVPTMASFDQVSFSQLNPSELLHPLIGTGDGLLGSYFPNQHLSGSPVTNRVDRTINFNYDRLIPKKLTNGVAFTNRCLKVLGMPKREEFGVRWVGEVQAQFTEPYTLYVQSDDGVRVWLNEQLIVDDWVRRAGQTLTVPVNLVAGQKYLLRVEHFEDGGDAWVELSWDSPSTLKQAIPRSQLYSHPTDTDSNGLPDIWEQHYFGHLGVDPNADADSDGLSNLQEYQMHRDPTDPLNWGVPNPWSHGDIGELIQSPGVASYSNGVFAVSSVGQETMRHIDDIHYVYQPLGTNGELVTRVLGIGGTNLQGKAGLMVRESLDRNARNTELSLNRNNFLTFQSRTVVDAMTGEPMTRSNRLAVSWLKLVRNNDWVGGYVSTNGTDWDLLDWVVIKDLAPSAFIGLMVDATGHRSLKQNLKGNQLGGLTTAQFSQVYAGPAGPTEVMAPVVGTGDGLLGSYHPDSLLYLPGVTNRVDPQIDFKWVHDPPVKTFNPDSYGVCWSGEVQAQFTEAYTFSLATRREDWVRVWVNNKLVINGWRSWHEDTAFKGKMNLVAGQHYLIRVEMFNNLGRGAAQLAWSSPSTPKQIIPQSQLYSQPVDTDGNGLPDIWEQLYFGHIGVDPNADADGDGLSNLQEYKYHTNPTKVDTDADGLPDAWEIAHGLDPQYADDAGLDYNNSGWSNLQDYQYGLDPFNQDANGDGLPDSFAMQYLGGNASTSHADVTSTSVAVNGAQAVNYLGNWQVDGNDIYALDCRGGLDFNLTVNTADKYVLNIIGTQNQINPFEVKFKLLLGVDGQTLGHQTLNAGYGTNGEVALVLPYLKAGTHTVHVFWDGYASFSSLRIKQVKLLAVAGADANQNGIKDWAENMIHAESGLDKTNPVIGSYTSPVCLEGRDPYSALLTVTNNQSQAMSPVATTDGRWYVDATLQANTQTVFQASYQNGALTETRNLQWLTLNVLTATNSLTIRKGDSLLISALPIGMTNGNLQVVIGTNTYSGKAAKGIACKFTTPGVQTVTATWTPNSGSPQSGSVTVSVVSSSLSNDQPAAWTWMQRSLKLGNLAPEATLKADSRLTCTITGTNSNGATLLNLATGDNEERSLIARLGTNGPVLDSTRVAGFDEWSGDQTYGRVIQIYPDGSQLIEMLMISSPVNTNVTFVLEPIVSGVMFDDGTTVKTLTSANFDPLGRYLVHFIRPASVHTSACHSIRAYQGNYQLGYRH